MQPGKALAAAVAKLLLRLGFDYQALFKRFIHGVHCAPLRVGFMPTSGITGPPCGRTAEERQGHPGVAQPLPPSPVLAQSNLGENTLLPYTAASLRSLS